MYGLARPLLFRLDPERAHRAGLDKAVGTPPAPLPTKLLGLTFPNPVGLAAGLDKNGAHVDALRPACASCTAATAPRPRMAATIGVHASRCSLFHSPVS